MREKLIIASPHLPVGLFQEIVQPFSLLQDDVRRHAD
jgi:hypothetical protein